MKKDPKALSDQAHGLAEMEREKGKALSVFAGDLSSDSNQLWSEVQFLVRTEGQAKYEVGRRLIVLYQMHEALTFDQMLEKYVPGMSRRSAYNRMSFARKVADLPALQSFGEKNFKKMLVILSSSTEEELKEAEKTGFLKGKPLDKYDTMTEEEKTAELRKRDAEKKEKKDAQGRLIDKLNKEVERLKKESETAKLGLPDDEEAMEKALQVELLKFDGVVAMLGTVDGTSLSPRMLTKYIGALEYINKYSLLEMLKAKQEYGDPSEQIFDGDIDEAEAIKVGGGWER